MTDEIRSKLRAEAVKAILGEVPDEWREWVRHGLGYPSLETGGEYINDVFIGMCVAYEIGLADAPQLNSELMPWGRARS